MRPVQGIAPPRVLLCECIRNRYLGKGGYTISLTVSAGFALWFGGMVLTAALARNRVGSRVGLLLSASLLPLPALVTGEPLQRGLLAFVIAACLARAVDFAFGRAPNGFGARLTYSFAFLASVDTLNVSSRTRDFDGRSAAQVALAVACGGTAVVLWSASADLAFGVRYIVRCLAAGIMVVAMAETVTGLVCLLTAALGVTVPPVHDAPYRSRGVSEFWSRRWNLATARWLREHCFEPLLPRGGMFALFATFSASAALHAYLIAAVDSRVALSWAAFFLAQPLVILVERHFHVRRWPSSAGRAWTIATLMLLFPLLFNPILRLFGTSL